jgi:hypothetical protein
MQDRKSVFLNPLQSIISRLFCVLTRDAMVGQRPKVELIVTGG